MLERVTWNVKVLTSQNMYVFLKSTPYNLKESELIYEIQLKHIPSHCGLLLIRNKDILVWYLWSTCSWKVSGEQIPFFTKKERSPREPQRIPRVKCVAPRVKWGSANCQGVSLVGRGHFRLITGFLWLASKRPNFRKSLRAQWKESRSSTWRYCTASSSLPLLLAGTAEGLLQAELLWLFCGSSTVDTHQNTTL